MPGDRGTQRSRAGWSVVLGLAGVLAFPLAAQARVPDSPNASCAPLVVSVASPTFGNLGLLFQALRDIGWSINAWPQVVQEKIGYDPCDGQ